MALWEGHWGNEKLGDIKNKIYQWKSILNKEFQDV